MERVTKAGAGERGGRASMRESGCGMPDLALHDSDHGRHADERDAVDRLPAEHSTADRHGRRAEANDSA
jgi:hypothetical protein